MFWLGLTAPLVFIQVLSIRLVRSPTASGGLLSPPKSEQIRPAIAASPGASVGSRMAANFWASSHCKQLLDPEEVDVVPAADRERGITPEEFRLVKIHMSLHIWRLAQQVKVRQRVIATAVTYFRRVYTRKSMTEYDPRLVAPTCLYLASKVEESTVQARLLVFYIKKMCASDEKYRFEIKDILEMEMKLLEALDYYLVVYHPYRPLLQLLQDAGITDLTQVAWGLVNDTYKMDLILIYPPYMIALACIYIASVLKDKDTTSWFEELRVDIILLRISQWKFWTSMTPTRLILKGVSRMIRLAL